MTKRPHSERWLELDALLGELLDRPEDRREARLLELTESDPDLYRLAAKMLTAGSDADSFLEEGAQVLAGDDLEDVVGDARGLDLLLEPPEASSEDGDVRLGPYRLLERLGAGGMGEVWLAERDDEVLHQTVAIKLLQPLAGPDGTARFHVERQILAALRHDGIAKILDAGAEAGSPPYLVLEYVEGCEITEHCRNRELDLAPRLDLFLDVCDAVAYAHRRFIVHRDLKPSNVLVTKDGRVKLVDFGIAKLLDPGAVALSGIPMTRTGLFLMTPEYAAPEQVLGETITTATDVYGLGALLYELLTGKRPFELRGKPAGEIERIVCHTKPAKPSTRSQSGTGERLDTVQWRKQLRGDLDTIVLKAMRKEPEERYATVQDLADDIRRFTEGHPVAARPATVGYRTRKFVQRNRAAVVATALIATASIAGLGGTLWQTRQAELQKARFDSTGAFLFALFEQVDPDLNPGSQLTAVSLLDIGVERLERLAAGPEARVDLLRVLGVLYGKLGAQDRSESLLRQAAREARAYLSPDNETIGQALNSLGKSLAGSGQLAESERVLLESIAALETAGETGLWPLGAGNDLALTLVLQGRWQEAEAALGRSIADHEPFLAADSRNLTHRSLANALVLLGELQTDLGRLTEAEVSLNRAAAIARERLGDKHPLLGRSLEGLGALQRRMGDLAGAAAHYREALETSRRAYPGGHHSTARALFSLAEIRTERGESTDARRLYDESMELWTTLPEGTHSERADRYRAQAARHRLDGDLGLARSLQQAALDARRLAHGSHDHWNVAEELHRLGSTDLAAGRLDEAEVELELALEMRRGLFGASDTAVDDALATLARLRRRQGRD